MASTASLRHGIIVTKAGVKAGDLIVANGDDEVVNSLSGSARGRWLTFGLAPGRAGFCFGMAEYQFFFEDGDDADDNFEDGQFVFGPGRTKTPGAVQVV